MYFDSFPVIFYDSSGDLIFKDVTNLLRRVGLRTKVRTNSLLYDTYNVKEGETPEIIAHKLYGDSELHWIVLLVNNVTDRYHQWPMNYSQFLQYINDKYVNADGTSNVDGVHHYEITQTSGRQSGQGAADFSHKVEVNSDEEGAVSISNRQYEERLQEQYSQIRLLDTRYLVPFIEEFDRLIKQEA